MANGNILVVPKMSRTSKQLKITNNSDTSFERSSNQRSYKAMYTGLDNPVSETVLLYKLVFLSKKAALLSILLCFSFFLQPFEKTSAQEPDPQTAGNVVVIENDAEVTEQVAVVESDSTEEQDTDTDIDTEQNEQESPLVSEQSTESDESELETSTVNSDLSPTVDGTQVASDEPVASSTVSELSTSATSTVAGVSTSTSNATTSQDNTATSGDDTESDQESPDTSEDIDTTNSNSSTSTENEDEGVRSDDESSGEFVSRVSSDSQFTFTKNECTKIDDGSFYCQNQKDSIELDDSLIAAPDVDGDLEIFLVRDGERYQLTHNTVDDASPYYDEYSQTIVWHRLINDRYQIVSYDIDSGDETQLTSTAVNNMEPSRHGDYTVWQRWIENNWEIILFDGKIEKQITDSARHDISPHVRGPLIIWNSQSNDGSQELKTYDIQNRTYTTIADADGVSVSNPRMVVVYEAVYENGDVVTKGYDLISGEIVPLESLPRQLPQELPDSDSTGETRALIQQKPETRDTELDENPNNVTPPATSTPEVSDGTLDLRPAASTTRPVIVEEVPPEIADIPDVIIPEVAPATNTATSTQ